MMQLESASRIRPRPGSAKPVGLRSERELPELAIAPASSLETGFRLPPELEAHEPPEARGLSRDAVRLMVSRGRGDRIVHTRFHALPELLHPGDLLVINTSGTLNAALPAVRADGTQLELHLSTRYPTGLWVVELRRWEGQATKPFSSARAGEALQLPEGGAVTLVMPYRLEPVRRTGAGGQAGRVSDAEAAETKGGPIRAESGRPPSDPPVRLWLAKLDGLGEWLEYLARNGAPIRYGYVPQAWPASYYQTVFANEPGSAEMPSAGRAFTAELVTRMVAGGVQVAPLVLHAGVASLEDHEPPYEEYYRVPLQTARQVNAARRAGRRVVAVGTTVVRALETVTDVEGRAHPGEGMTRLIITPQRGLRAVNGLITGLHEPGATHLAMLEALAGPVHVQRAYLEALRERYLWHEFGDLHLILP